MPPHKTKLDIKRPSLQILYCVITLLSIAVVVILYLTKIIELKDIGTSILALFGTFLGATLAFRLSEAKEAENSKRLQREAMNRALFILIRQINAITQILRDFNKFPSPFEKAFNMPALKPPDYGSLIHNISDLEFIINSNNANLLFELTISQELFHQVIDSIQVRNEFYINEVQPKIADAKINKKRFTFEYIQEILGERIFGGAMNGSKNAYELLSSANESLPKVLSDMRKLAQEIYPKHKFIDFSLKDNTKNV